MHGDFSTSFTLSGTAPVATGGWSTFGPTLLWVADSAEPVDDRLQERSYLLAGVCSPYTDPPYEYEAYKVTRPPVELGAMFTGPLRIR